MRAGRAEAQGQLQDRREPSRAEEGETGGGDKVLVRSLFEPHKHCCSTLLFYAQDTTEHPEIKDSPVLRVCGQAGASAPSPHPGQGGQRPSRLPADRPPPPFPPLQPRRGILRDGWAGFTCRRQMVQLV